MERACEGQDLTSPMINEKWLEIKGMVLARNLLHARTKVGIKEKGNRKHNLYGGVWSREPHFKTRKERKHKNNDLKKKKNNPLIH